MTCPACMPHSEIKAIRSGLSDKVVIRIWMLQMHEMSVEKKRSNGRECIDNSHTFFTRCKVAHNGMVW